MDWSAVFEDVGEEEGDWTRDEVSSARTGILQLLQLEGSYGPGICYAFTVNYILGVGCLGIPYAFLKCGILLGSLLTVFIAYVSFITVMWVAVASQQEIQLTKYLAYANPFITTPPISKKKKISLKVGAEAEEMVPINAASTAPTMSGATATATAISSSVGPASGLSPTRKAVQEIADSLYSSFKGYTGKLMEGGGCDSEEAMETPELLARRQSFLERKKKEKIKRKRAMRVLSSSAINSGNENGYSSADSGPNNEDHVEELEVTDLAKEFLGPGGKLMYQSSLMLLTYVGLLAYSQVFNSSFISQFWPTAPQYVPALLFSVIAVPLSCFDLTEQVTMQVLMSALRFLSLGILLIGTIVAMVVDPFGGGGGGGGIAMKSSSGDSSVGASVSSSTHGDIYSSDNSSWISAGLPPLFNLAGFGIMFTTAIFSQLFQHSVPGLIRPLSDEHKKQVPQIFKYALITTSVIYIATGCACVWYFGNNLQQSVNLNFVGFYWGLNKYDTDDVVYDEQDGGSSDSGYIDVTHHHHMSAAAFLASGVAMVVVLFPAIDTLSVFPLIANTLGNNLNSAFPALGTAVKHSGWAHDSKSVRRMTLTVWRLVAAIPPIVASVFVSELVFTLQIAGLCGIVVALITPALLQRQSQLRCALLPARLKSMILIRNEYTNVSYSTSVLVLAAVAIVISCAQMIQAT